MTLSKLKLEELGRLTPEEFKQTRKVPLTLVVDNVRSGHNVGSFFRTADAFAIERICLCGISPTPPHKEINKTAIGATTTVEWSYYNTTREAIDQLKESGCFIIGVEQTTKSVSLSEFEWKGEALAIVVGNEVDGLQEDILPLLDFCFELEQFGTKHSLNVSVCTGIVLWELGRQFRHLKS